MQPLNSTESLNVELTLLLVTVTSNRFTNLKLVENSQHISLQGKLDMRHVKTRIVSGAKTFIL